MSFSSFIPRSIRASSAKHDTVVSYFVKSKVMRYSRNGNRGRMHVILNGELFEEVDCLKYLGSQVAADRGCERDAIHKMNEGYRAWGVLKVC